MFGEEKEKKMIFLFEFLNFVVVLLSFLQFLSPLMLILSLFFFPLSYLFLLGSWQQIREEKALNLKDKINLGSDKNILPRTDHVSRRLVVLLKNLVEGKKKERKKKSEGGGGRGAAAGSKRKRGEKKKEEEKKSSKRKKKRKRDDSSSSSSSSSEDAYIEKKLVEKIRHDYFDKEMKKRLKKMRLLHEKKDMDKEHKKKKLKQYLEYVGDEIGQLVYEKGKGDEARKKKLGKHMWHVAASYTSKSGDVLEKFYAQIKEQQD